MSSQTWSVMFLFFFFLTFLSKRASSTECIEVSSPRTRVFNTLLDLQANKISFDPSNRNFQGNYVTIKQPLDDDVLERNAFISFGSNFVIKMFLDGHNIKTIQDGAFISLDCLKTLDLSRNRIESLSRLMFQGLKNLHELDLSRNAIQEIPERVFTLTPRLKKLNLSTNSLKTLHPESFFNLFILEDLDLSHNTLHAITPLAFQFFDRLLRLDLSFNRIDVLEFEKWNTSKLQRLDLSQNHLESFDTSYRFSFSLSLTELLLNDNLLVQLNQFGLRNNLPNLKRIDLNNNPWSCAHLEDVIQTLNDSRVVYQGLTTVKPHVNGIACNRSVEVYRKNKIQDELVEADETIFDANDANSVRKNYADDLTEQKNTRTVELLGRISYFATATFVVVCLYVLFDFIVRARLLHGTCDFLLGRMWRRRNNHVLDNNASVENVGLLQDRYL